jgi:hypothetical protein
MPIIGQPEYAEWEDLDDRIRGLGEALETLDKAIYTARKAVGAKMRPLATAEALAVYLDVARMNLLQFKAFLFPKGIKPGRNMAGWITHRPRINFCHGGAAVVDAPIHGKARLGNEWKDLCSRVDRVIRQQQGTPWEILVRRAVIVDFELHSFAQPSAVRPPASSTTENKPTRGAGSATPSGPETPPSAPPPSPTRHSRGGSGSSSGSRPTGR